MAKQTVLGSSGDRWQQRPPSRGSGLIPQAPQVSALSSATGMVNTGSGSGPGVSGHQPHHQHHFNHPPPHLTHPSSQYPRKKGPGTSSSLGQQGHTQSSGGGGGGGREEMKSPPGPQGERSGDRRGGGGGGGPGGAGDVPGSSIIHQHDLETLESCSRNPLLCLICNNVYEDPRLLSCYHSFCAKCLPGRMGETKLACPLCGKPTALKDSSGPPTDHLLRFLLHTSSDVHPTCANCDNKNRVVMYYCNTCGQVLCNGCREETHRAKMFSAHDVIPVSKYTKDTPKKCSVHGEQYIMFSNVQKSMLCINCYRDTHQESRLHCVDLETAYNQGCRKLDRAVMSLRDLQVAVRDGITMLKNVLEELRRNSDSEKSAVNAVCQTILDALTKTQENLLRDVDCQMEGKDKVIRGQLSQLRSVLPTIKLHLAMCATIANATNKYDFLDLAYPLIDRLTAITHLGYPIRPGQSSQIKSTYKSEIARTLEPWVAGAQPTTASSSSGIVGAVVSTVTNASASSHIPKDYAHPSVNLASTDPGFTEPTYSQYYPMSRSTVTPVMGHKPPAGLVGGGYAAPAGIGAASSGRKTPMAGGYPKGKGDGPDDHFAAHCRSFTAQVNDLNQRLNRLKEQVQELHRDVTLQRGTSHATRAENCIREGMLLEDQLERRHAEMERIRKHLESHWNENLRQIRMEQEVFQSQMNDLLAMKSEVKQLSNLLQQLQSFLKSLNIHQQQQQPGGGGGGGAGGSSGGGGTGGGGGGGGGAGGGPVGPAHPSGPGTPHPAQVVSGQGSRPGQQQLSQDDKSYHHMSSAPAPETFTRRADIGSQVTPSLGDLNYADVSKGSGKSDFGGMSGRSGGMSQGVSGSISSFVPLPGSSSMGGGVTPSGKGHHQLQPQFHGHQGQQGSSGGPYGGGGGGQSRGGFQGKRHSEMEYIQVDTSYPQMQVLGKSGGSGVNRMIGTHQMGNAQSEAAMKKGVLSQLIDKVRSKDDRKKSSASGVSSSSSGGTIPQPVIPPHQSTTSTATPAPPPPRRALTAMYDAQCQYGLDSSTSAVSALALANTPSSSRHSHQGHSQQQQQQHQHDSRPTYTRAKSFVKSKSDDERPPSKLSKQLRARSAGQLETESLLRSLSTGTKDASRILSLYQSLSKTIIERENQQYQQQQHQQSLQRGSSAYPQSYNHQYSDHKSGDLEATMSEVRRVGGSSSTNAGNLMSSLTKPGANGTSRANFHSSGGSHSHMKSSSLGRVHKNSSSPSMARSSDGRGGRRGDECLTPSEDDYQQIPMTRTHPITRSHSAPPRKHAQLSGSSGQTEVKVFVHEEPRTLPSSSSGGGRGGSSGGQEGNRSPSPSATLSKSLEESYLYGYLSQHRSGGLTSSSSGQSGFCVPSGAFTILSSRAKPASCESLISLDQGNSGGSHSRKSSIDFDRRSVVTVRRAGSKSALITRQHSWEAGAQLSGKREQSASTPHLSPSDDPFGSERSSPQSGTVDGGATSARTSRIYDDEDVVGNTLHKADSFEGHEEAVRSIVAAVQETRTLQRRLQSN